MQQVQETYDNSSEPPFQRQMHAGDGVAVMGEPSTEVSASAAAHAMQTLIKACHDAAVKAGWWTDLNTGESLIGKRNFGEMIALATSELSEALEGDRKKLNDDKLTHRPMVECEFADFMIRLADTSGAHDLPTAQALAAILPFPRAAVAMAMAIRTVLDFAAATGSDVITAVPEKMEFNRHRPDHKLEQRRLAGGKTY